MYLLLIVIAFVSCMASCVSMISGFGVGTIMTPLMLLFMPLPQALFLVGVIHLLNGIGKVVFFSSYIRWDLVLLSGMPAVIASLLGALLVGNRPDIIVIMLGIFFIFYSILIFYNPKIYLKPYKSIVVAGGGIYGFLAGISGVRGAVRAMFFSALDLTKQTYIATTGVISVAVDLTRLITYWQYSLELDFLFFKQISIAIIGTFIGTYLGQYLMKKIPQKYFRHVVALFLLLMGVRLLVF